MKMEHKKKPEIDSTTKKYEKIQMENKKKHKFTLLQACNVAGGEKKEIKIYSTATTTKEFTLLLLLLKNSLYYYYYKIGSNTTTTKFTLLLLYYCSLYCRLVTSL